jgi:hypothetical protein
MLSSPRDHLMVFLNTNTAAGARGGFARIEDPKFAFDSVGEHRYDTSFDPLQATYFGSLEFVADRFGHLHLYGTGELAPEVPILPMGDITAAQGVPPMVDPDAIAQSVTAHLGPDPGPEV